MRYLLTVLVALMLALSVAPTTRGQSIPPGCTPTACTGSTLPSGYFTTSGNQVVAGSGATVRISCADFLGSPNDGSMAAIRQAGYDCVRIPWRDALLPVPLIFQDNFTSLSLHQNWQAGDNWGIGATFDGGLGQGGPWLGDFGSQWWINPFNPNTAFQSTPTSAMLQGTENAGNPSGTATDVNRLAALWVSDIGPQTEVEVFLDDTQPWSNVAGSGTEPSAYTQIAQGTAVAGNPPAWVTVSMPMAVTSDASPAAAFNAIIAGTHDADIRNIINTYPANGITNIILRPGWEMNLPEGNGGWPWSIGGSGVSTGPTASDASLFRQAWQHIYTLVKSIPGVNVQVSWIPADGWSIGSGATSMYPGDAYVDDLGGDFYDNVSVTDPNYSVTSAAQMAVAHGKPFAVGEMAPNCNCVGNWATYMPEVQSALLGVAGLTVHYINLFTNDPNFGGVPYGNTGAENAIKNMLSAVSSFSASNAGGGTVISCGTNCYANGIYQINPTGTLQLGLQSIPSYMQSYINTQSQCAGSCSGTGGYLSYLGGLLNGQNTDLHTYGYWQFGANVPAIPGFDFQFDIESYNAVTNTNNPPEIDYNLYTNADNSQHFSVNIEGYGIIYSTTSLNITTTHTYGLNWQPDYITVYVDGSQVAQVATATAGSSYLAAANNPMFPYLLTAADYRSNTNPTLPTGGAYANVIGPFYSYTMKPGAGTGCNSTADIATCVANAAAQGLRVIFQHRGNEAITTSNSCYYTRQQNGLWYDLNPSSTTGISNNTDGCGDTGTITPSAFQNDWVNLASQFNGNSTVIGAELHYSPTITATARSGGGGTGSGTFSVSGGHVIDPNGNVFHAYGADISDAQLSSGNATMANIQSLFPKLNMIRVVIGDGNCTTAQITNCNVAVSTMEPIIQQFLNAGIVMVIDPHVGNQAAGSSINYVNEATLMGEYAADLKGNNGFLWCQSGNELTNPISQEHANVYNACHNAGAPWATSTNYPVHAVRNANGNLYLQTTGTVGPNTNNSCTSASSGSGPSGTGSGITDGSCHWNYLKSYSAATAGGFNSIIAFDSQDGNPFPQGGAPDTASAYNNMQNVIWDQHFYNWYTCAEAGGSVGSNCPSFLSQMNNQTTVNGYLATAQSQGESFTTSASGVMPTISLETGFIDYAYTCGGPSSGTEGSSYSCGTGQVVTGTLSGQNTGLVGGTIWNWDFDNGCCAYQTDLTVSGSSPAALFDSYGSYVQSAIAANSSGPIIVTGSGGPPNSVTWGGGGTNNSDLVQMCNAVGAAVQTANPNLLISCPGLVNNTGTTLLSGVTKPAGCTNIPDLTLVPTAPMSSVAAAKRMYDVDFWPTNINGTGCVDSGGSLAADLNAYWGNLIKNAQAFVMVNVGCSCDGTNGALADDNAYGAAMQSYLNGTLSGGPTFTSTQQPVSNDWWTWYYPASGGSGQNPDGILLTSGSGVLNVGQQQWWYSLLFNPATSPTTGTAWNPNDSLNMSLSNSNKTSTVTTSGTAAVRSTTSKTTGNECEEFTLNTIGTTSAVGLANTAFSLSQTLGTNANGVGITPGGPGPYQAFGPAFSAAFGGVQYQTASYNNALLTVGAGVSTNGDPVTVCESLGSQKIWFTDLGMRGALGSTAWNNSATCNPTVSTCGLSFSGMTGPYLLAFNATGVQTTTTVWNPADQSPSIVLSNGQLTASASQQSSVRATTSKSSGKYCVEFTATTISSDWNVGLANSSFVLGNSGGLGSDNNGIGFDPNSAGGLQGIFLNNAVLSSGTTASVNGDRATICEDFGAQLFWATDAAMRAAGNAWNNLPLASSNPATGVGGISTAALTCPCFPIFDEFEVGVAGLNTAGPFAVATPAGFSPWDTATSLLPITTLNTAGPFTVATPSGFVPWDQTIATAASQILSVPMASP